jgi:hypothetical protein
MKNILVIGILSLVLFSASAAMSVWLQTSKQTAATTPEEKDGKKKPGGHATEPEKGKSEAGHEPKAGTEPDSHGKPVALKPVDAGPTDKDDRAEVRRLQMQIISQDMRQQFAEFDKRAKQLSVELKALQGDIEATDAQMKTAKELEEQNKKKEEQLAKQSKQPSKPDLKPDPVTVLPFEGMEPEKLVAMITQMADSGELDRAAALMMSMKPSKSSKVLSLIPDPSFANDLYKKMTALGAEKVSATK